MRRSIWAMVTACAMSATVSHARTRYEPYGGPDAVHAASRGTVVRKNGVDWWVQGAPNRAFEVIGFVRDDRDSLPLSGKAVGSRAVAKMVSAANGDGVILLNSKADLVYLPQSIGGGDADPLHSPAARARRIDDARRRQVYLRTASFAVIRYR